jgi:mannose-6-phosphate isomerase class I
MCALTQDEQVARGKSLAKVLAEIRNEDSRHAMLKAEMKSTMTAMESERDKFQLIVAGGEELRDVECEDIANYDSGMFERVRFDTGETVYQRALTPEELQMELPGTKDGLAIVPVTPDGEAGEDADGDSDF